MSEVVPVSADREEAIVKWWNVKRGFGMLTPVLGGADCFAHINQTECEPRELVEGEHVSFVWRDGPKGPQAQKIRRVK
jgi:CspA family cold shock protein